MRDDFIVARSRWTEEVKEQEERCMGSVRVLEES